MSRRVTVAAVCAAALAALYTGPHWLSLYNVVLAFTLFTYVTSPKQLQVAGGAAQTIKATYTPGTGFVGSTSTNSLTETVTPDSV